MLFNKLGFSFMWDSLNRKAKRDILNKLVSQIEITRDKNYNIEIKNIKFTDEFISRSCKEYLEYLNDILKNNNIGIKYQELITTDELNNYSKNYYVLSLQKLEKNEYSNDEHFLPNISTISIIKTKGELINKIKEELYLGNLNKEEVDLIFNKLEKNISRKKYIVKDEEKNSFLNEKNKAINKLVKYFETIESG